MSLKWCRPVCMFGSVSGWVGWVCTTKTTDRRWSEWLETWHSSRLVLDTKSQPTDFFGFKRLKVLVYGLGLGLELGCQRRFASRGSAHTFKFVAVVRNICCCFCSVGMSAAGAAPWRIGRGLSTASSVRWPLHVPLFGWRRV